MPYPHKKKKKGCVDPPPKQNIHFGWSEHVVTVDYLPEGDYIINFVDVELTENILIRVKMPTGDEYEAYKLFQNGLEFESKNQFSWAKVEYNKIIQGYGESLYAILARKRYKR